MMHLLLSLRWKLNQKATTDGDAEGGLRWEESGEATLTKMPAFNVLFSSPPI
jgi:hypothetical protein